MALVTEVYRVAGHLPGLERSRLGSELRRAAVSVPLNIAEGHGRYHLGDYGPPLSVANGSLRELETALETALGPGYLSHQSVASILERCQDVGRMPGGLIRSIQRRRSQSPGPPVSNL